MAEEQSRIKTNGIEWHIGTGDAIHKVKNSAIIYDIILSFLKIARQNCSITYPPYFYPSMKISSYIDQSI